MLPLLGVTFHGGEQHLRCRVSQREVCNLAEACIVKLFCLVGRLCCVCGSGKPQASHLPGKTTADTNGKNQIISMLGSRKVQPCPREIVTE